MRTRAENLSILRNASGGSFSAGGPSGERARSRDESLRILGSPLGGAVERSVTEGGTTATSASAQPPYRFATLSTSPSRGRLPGDQNGREGAALGGGPQNGSPTGATEPMSYGGGGFSAGGGGRDGRADERATLQEQLNELDEAASYVTTTEQSDGIERQRKPLIEQLRRMDEEEGKSGVYTAGDRLKNAGANAKLMVQQGLTIADHNIAQTADWLFGGIAKEGRALLNTTLQSINPEWGFENEEALITQYNKRGEEVLLHNQAIAEKRIEEKKLNPTAWKYAPQVVAAVPDAVLAVLTYGSSAAPQATRKGLEVASRLKQGGELYQKVAPLVQSTQDMMRSPQWLSAFARSAGPSYEAALADGTSEELATLYALANGYANATIEVGGGDEALGGIQKLPKQLQNLIRQGNSNKLLLWAKSTLGEAGEEVWQGLTEKGLRGIYTDEVPLYSQTDENAVINPSRMKEEAKGGFVVGGLLGGGQTTVQSLGTVIKAPAGNNVPLQQNIDNAAQQRYTEINEEMNGGTENGIRDAGLQQNDPGRSVPENRAGIPGIYQYSNSDNSGQRESGGVRVDTGFVLISEKALSILQKRGIVPVEAKDVSTDKTAFSYALDAARNSNSTNGWAVTPKSAEELEQSGARLFMDERGSAGLAVAPDGDIEAVFANKAAGAPKSATKSLIPMAIANGGTKLDCYGEGLVSLYAQYGFTPVARTKFDPQYANPGWDSSKGTPDIYFLMHNGDNADTVVEKIGSYPVPTAEQLNALPEMDYDSAYAYRDRLLAERSGKGAPLGGAGTHSVTEGGTTAVSDQAAKTDPAAAAQRQQYQTEITAALQAGDYRHALKLFNEFGNPNLRALNEVQTLKAFTEFANDAGYGVSTVVTKEQPSIVQKKAETKKLLENSANSSTMNLPDVPIGRSLGAKLRDYEVMELDTGEMFRFVEGSRLQNVKVFAGKGTKVRYNNAWKYAQYYGGNEEDWQHVKGFGLLETWDGDRRAEVHWSQCNGIGLYDFFVKRWLE